MPDLIVSPVYAGELIRDNKEPHCTFKHTNSTMSDILYMQENE